MSPETRSRVMSRIRGKNTGPERILGQALAALGLHWDAHAIDLPGRPDFIFREAKLAVFVDGDFWHGWRFSEWRDKLSIKWEQKIEQTRRRDQRNHRKLRRQGWAVIRLWEHQVKSNLPNCVEKVVHSLHRAQSDIQGHGPRL